MLRVTLPAICLGILTAAMASGQKPFVPPTFPTPPHTPQEILLLFSGNTADERILLTLNNNRAGALTTSVMVYTASGLAIKLKDISMVPQESKLVELSTLLQDAGLNHQELGWIKLDYSGVIMEMGAQLTLYPTPGAPGVDSPRSLSADFLSGERDAVFWMPQGSKAHLAFANASTDSIVVKASCGHGPEQFVIPAKTAQTKEIDPADLGLLFHDGRMTMSCELSSSGAIDALRAVGTVTAPGYTAPIRFYDPHTATFPSLTAVGLESAAETHVAVHNVTDSPVEFTPILRQAALTDPLTQTLPSRTLAAHASAQVDFEPLLSTFRAKAIPLVTLTLKTIAAKGSLVGAVTQISSPDQLVEDIPLRTSAPPAYARGSYPLRWDVDYTNMVTVTNTAEEVLRIGGVITAGDMGYVLTRTDINPGATIVLDVDKWKREQTPDVNGKVLPKDAPFGKIHWIEMAGGTKAGLLGRTSLTSVSDRRKSSFSCNNPCQYNYDSEPNFDASIFTSLYPNSYQVSAVTQYIVPANGSSYAYPLNYSANGVSTTNSAIASTGPDTVSTSIRVNGNSSGTVTMSYDQFITQYQPNYPAQSCSVAQSTQPVSGSTNVMPPPGCPTGMQITKIVTKSLPEVDFPANNYLTGVGILTLMTLTPSSQQFAGITIQESVTPIPGSNTCPASVREYTDFPTVAPSGSGFNPGTSSAHWEGVDYGPIAKSFYDSHRTLFNFDVLGAGGGVSQCQAQASQVYYCQGQPITNFILTNVYTHGTLNGTPVTNVTTTKQ